MTALEPVRVHAAPRPPRPAPPRGIGRHDHNPYRSHNVLTAPQLRAGTTPRTGRLRILAYVDRYPPFVNAGAEWMLHHLLRDSVRRGHQVDVATAVPDGPHDVEGVTVWPIARIDQLAAEADVMIGHLLWTRQVIETADEHQVPLLYIVHNDSQVAYWRLGPANVTMLVHNSRWIADAHPEWDGPAEIVRPPVLTGDYRVDRTGAQAITLVNPIPEKGAHTFYALAHRFPERAFLAVQGAYGRQIPPPAVLRNVELHPQTPRMGADIYARTRVLLMPSSYESWGRVACEALCSGIPVIAHPTPGLLEALGDAAIFLERDHHQAWARALTDLDDPDTYQSWSQRASARAEHLGRQAGEDHDTWDRVLRLAAAAERNTP